MVGSVLDPLLFKLIGLNKQFFLHLQTYHHFLLTSFNPQKPPKTSKNLPCALHQRGEFSNAELLFNAGFAAWPNEHDCLLLSPAELQMAAQKCWEESEGWLAVGEKVFFGGLCF